MRTVDVENSGGDADLSPRLVGICREKAVGFPLPSFRDTSSPFLYPVFAIITGTFKISTVPAAVPVCRNRSSTLLSASRYLMIVPVRYRSAQCDLSYL